MSESGKAIAKAPPLDGFLLETDQWTAPFWNACRDHRLTAPCCADCGAYRMPPTPFCPACRSQAVEWPALSGNGVLFSYTIVDRAMTPAMESSLPYVPAVVELPDAGGVRLITNVVGIALADLRIGMALRVAWADGPEELVLPVFETAD